MNKAEKQALSTLGDHSERLKIIVWKEEDYNRLIAVCSICNEKNDGIGGSNGEAGFVCQICIDKVAKNDK